eukprot:scaffold6898_cov123-Cylindrotheca_fusiformis.AAC.13
MGTECNFVEGAGLLKPPPLILPAAVNTYIFSGRRSMLRFGVHRGRAAKALPFENSNKRVDIIEHRN